MDDEETDAVRPACSGYPADCLWSHLDSAGSECPAWKLMTGQIRWAYRGGIAVVAGLAILVGFRKQFRDRG